jgi:predicted nucleic acid-binding protein
VPVLLDTGVLYAYYDRSDTWHRRALLLMGDEAGGLVLPAPVIPEADHLIGRRLGSKAQRVFHRSLADGDYLVVDLPRDGYARIADLNDRFSDLALGFVDAAVVAIAETTGMRRIATTDRRRFDPLAAALDLELLP